jgi:carbon-monoxide dehydrogenase medium subunit
LSWQAETRLYIAPTLDDAVAALAERGRDGAPLAGATWIMRASLREERHDLSYVAISKIASLRELSVGERELSIGACVTHAEIARELTSVPDCRALALAASDAANPAIRQVATIGGNLCRQILRPQTSCRRCCVSIPRSNCMGWAELSKFR